MSSGVVWDDAPIASDLVVSPDHVFNVQPFAGVDLHRTLFLARPSYAKNNLRQYWRMFLACMRWLSNRPSKALSRVASAALISAKLS